jgi:Tol biopolymer transport system component
MATRFDPATLEVSDERVTVVSGVYLDPSVVGGNYAVSAAGTLAYVPGDGSHFRRTLMTAGPSGLRPLIEERRYYSGARASPDGKRIAVLVRAWKDDLWTIDVERGTFTLITTGDQSAANAPVWSPDGRHVVFSRLNFDGPVNLFRALSDGNGPEEQLAPSAFAQTPDAFSADGRTLVFTERRPDTGNDLLLLSLDDRKVRPLLATRFEESAAAVSPNGGLIAFQSNRSGRSEVYVAPFPSMVSTVQVSSEGGNDPVWSSDGRRLYYNRAGLEAIIQAVDVAAGAPIMLSRPRTVGEYSMAGRVYDVLPNDRFLFVAGTGYGGSTRELHIILNWHEELKQKVREGIAK